METPLRSVVTPLAHGMTTEKTQPWGLGHVRSGLQPARHAHPHIAADRNACRRRVCCFGRAVNATSGEQEKSGKKGHALHRGHPLGGLNCLGAHGNGGPANAALHRRRHRDPLRIDRETGIKRGIAAGRKKDCASEGRKKTGHLFLLMRPLGTVSYLIASEHRRTFRRDLFLGTTASRLIAREGPSSARSARALGRARFRHRIAAMPPSCEPQERRKSHS